MDALWTSRNETWRCGANLCLALHAGGEIVLPVNVNKTGVVWFGISQALQPFQGMAATSQGNCSVAPQMAAVQVQLCLLTSEWWAQSKTSTRNWWNLEKICFFSTKIKCRIVSVANLKNKWLYKPCLYHLMKRNPGQLLPGREVHFGSSDMLLHRKQNFVSWFSCRISAWRSASGLILLFSLGLNWNSSMLRGLWGAPSALCSDIAAETSPEGCFGV